MWLFFFLFFAGQGKGETLGVRGKEWLGESLCKNSEGCVWNDFGQELYLG